MNYRPILIGSILTIVLLILWQGTKQVPVSGDWQAALAVLSTAEFKGDVVTVKNIRNFRYNGSEEEADVIPAYHDKTYDLNKLSRVWFVADPFKENDLAAHTFLSFEFSDGEYLSITIEARKLKGQKYGLIKGAFRTYPLMYIAADERDTIHARTNIRKDRVFLYPVRTTPEKGRALLVDMLEEMNGLAVKPQWYNTIWANCTSRIAFHINRVTPGRIPSLNVASFVTGFADRFAFDHGLIDSDLSFEKTRERFEITEKARSIELDADYSKHIREFSPLQP